MNLVGILHKSKNHTDSVVIIAHGFAANKNRERLIQLAETLSGEGISAFRFDFGGSGDSDNRDISIKGQVDDLRSAVSLMNARGYNNIGLVGESLAGIVSLQTCDNNIKAMTLWAPVTSAKNKEPELTTSEKNELKKHGYYTFLKDGREFKVTQEYLNERKSFNTEEALKRVDIPVLIIHGDNDTTVPLHNSKKSIKLLPFGSQLEIVDGGSHTLNESLNYVIPKTVDWLNIHLLKRDVIARS